MGSSVLLAIVGLTSIGTYLAATRRGSMSSADLRGAIEDALHTLGLAMVFSFGNLIVGAALILGLRVATGHFISVYLVTDVTVAVLSLVQALIFRSWRERPR